MIKAKQKQSVRLSKDSQMQKTDKKIKQLTEEIAQSKQKIQQQLSKLDDHIGNIIKVRLTKFVALHAQIIQSKDIQHRKLKQHYQNVKMSHLNQNLIRLQKNIQRLQAENQSTNKVRDTYRKQIQQLRIDLDIKEKQILMSSKRQKQLMRHVWILQEDIKDIYYDNAKKEITHRHQSSNERITNRKILVDTRCTHQKVMSTEKPKQKLKYKAKTDKKILYTQLVQPLDSQNKQFSTVPGLIQRKYLNFKHSGITRLQQKLGISYRKTPLKKSKEMLAQPLSKSRYSNFNQKPLFSNHDIYQQLRQAIRRGNNHNQNTQNMNMQEQSFNQIPLSLSKFKLVCLYGLRIMKQIQKITIEKYGSIHEIDEESIELLLTLFRSQNATKILQIVLFNYSLQALEEIKQQQEALIIQKKYDIPSINNSPQPLLTRQMHKRINSKQEYQMAKKTNSKRDFKKVYLRNAS